MGKIILFVVCLMGATNGFWYCATQQDTMGQTPVIVIAVGCLLGTLIMSLKFILENWNS